MKYVMEYQTTPSQEQFRHQRVILNSSGQELVVQAPISTLLPWIALFTAVGNIWFDYISLLGTRFWMKRASGRLPALCGILVADAAVSGFLGSLSVYSALSLGTTVLAHFSPNSVLVDLFVDTHGRVSDFLISSWWMDIDEYWLAWFVSAYFSSLFLWLYAGSGFLLKAARRFDIGFDWFNRKFDIEKKPLQSIGLVAGALVAVVYWAAVVVSRVVG